MPVLVPVFLEPASYLLATTLVVEFGDCCFAAALCALANLRSIVAGSRESVLSRFVRHLQLGKQVGAFYQR